MFDEKFLSQLEGSLRRIFAMKITRSTFREIQNMLLTLTNGDKDIASDILESLFTGQVKDTVSKGKGAEAIKAMTREFSIPIRLSKEVLERGEFVSIITSDTISQKDRVGLLNRMRRTDGEEFLFITDTESTIHLLQHFAGRMQELEKVEAGKEQLMGHRKDIILLKAKVDALLAALSEKRT
ncbi:MAG: DUF5414 family protein [Parachlamydiales bacterium]|nr:DUF5414 family protein [Parachlamydiales bacterium]